jgi:hypothetical protein
MDLVEDVLAQIVPALDNARLLNRSASRHISDHGE